MRHAYASEYRRLDRLTPFDTNWKKGSSARSDVLQSQVVIDRVSQFLFLFRIGLGCLNRCVTKPSYLGEAFNDARLDMLLNSMPISGRGTLQRYVGRLHRLYENTKVVQVFDYADVSVPMLARMYKKRLAGYKDSATPSDFLTAFVESGYVPRKNFPFNNFRTSDLDFISQAFGHEPNALPTICGYFQQNSSLPNRNKTPKLSLVVRKMK